MEETTITIDEVQEEKIEEKAEKKAAKTDDLLSIIEPNKSTITWKFGVKEYKQRPLSYFGKLEFFSYLGQTIDVMTAGEVQQLLQQFFGSGEENTTVSVSDIRGTGLSGLSLDGILKIAARLMMVAPDFLLECYCIWLSVPRGEREAVKEIMESPVDDGGLSDDDAFKIMEKFLDQNVDAIENFFRKQLPTLFRRGQGLWVQNQKESEK